MGTPLPSRVIDFGDDCEACVPPAGSLWEIGETPKYLYVTFNGLVACPNFAGILPNGQIFKMTQHDTIKCLWICYYGDYEIWFWSFDPLWNWSALYIWHTDGKWLFQGMFDPCPFEYHAMQNIIETCPNHVYAHFGYGVVCWNDIAIDVADDIVLDFNPGLQHEFFAHEDGDIVLKYCDKRDATNVKVKYSLA